ncbi:hypothetical protein GCM10023196_073900 [Actinoallomurus vinaceus]|uniref:Uncharacterized protein n=1 Tax=Actinoallomurus vinaceus TaxID=1080074 RepID=A0ABP8UL16_9ACTN
MTPWNLLELDKALRVSWAADAYSPDGQADWRPDNSLHHLDPWPGLVRLRDLAAPGGVVRLCLKRCLVEGLLVPSSLRERGPG